MPWRPLLRAEVDSNSARMLARAASDYLDHYEHCDVCGENDYYAPQGALCRVGRLTLGKWDRLALRTPPKSN